MGSSSRPDRVAAAIVKVLSRDSAAAPVACIEAPETAQTPFGVASRNQLKALLPLGSTVSLRVQAVDRYGRSVAEVIGKGAINLAMVQSGQAFVYRQYLGRCDRQAYLAAERQAQAQRLGVWAVPGGITRPWLRALRRWT